LARDCLEPLTAKRKQYLVNMRKELEAAEAAEAAEAVEV
jgi:hypothetical protein